MVLVKFCTGLRMKLVPQGMRVGQDVPMPIEEVSRVPTPAAQRQDLYSTETPSPDETLEEDLWRLPTSLNHPQVAGVPCSPPAIAHTTPRPSPLSPESLCLHNSEEGLVRAPAPSTTRSDCRDVTRPPSPEAGSQQNNPSPPSSAGPPTPFITRPISPPMQGRSQTPPLPSSEGIEIPDLSMPTRRCSSRSTAGHHLNPYNLPRSAIPNPGPVSRLVGALSPTSAIVPVAVHRDGEH